MVNLTQIHVSSRLKKIYHLLLYKMKFLKIRQNYTDRTFTNELTRDKSPQSSSRVDNQSNEAIHIAQNENVMMRFQRRRRHKTLASIIFYYCTYIYVNLQSSLQIE